MAIDQFKSVDIIISKIDEDAVPKQVAVEGERSGRSLTVQITNGGIVEPQLGINLALGWKHLTAKNSNGEPLQGLDAFSVLNRNQGVFRIEYTSAMMVAGNVDAVIQITSNNSVVRTRPFKIKIDHVPFDESAAESDNSFTALQAALVNVSGYDGKIQELENTKANQSFVDAQFESIISGTPKDVFDTLDALKSAYPNGAEGIFLVSADGNWYYWNTNSKQWKSGGVYQAEQKKFSVIPRNPDLWHMFKVSTNIGDNYIFNNTINTIENTDNYFETSVASYGSFTKLLEIPKRGIGTILYLRGTRNYRISVMEYSSEKKVIKTSEWANRIDWKLSLECRYIVFAIKRYDEMPMLFSELNYIDCDVQSDVMTKEFTEEIKRDVPEKFGEWIQGMYNAPINGDGVKEIIYSNYRMSNTIAVNPSTKYVLTANLASKYRYAIDLFDSDKKKIISCGWSESRKELVVRTPPNCYYMIVSIATINDKAVFKDEQRLELNLKLTHHENLSIISQYFGPETDQVFSLKENTWLNCSIGKTPEGKITTPPVDNRLLTRVDVQAEKNYTIITKSPSNFQFNYIQVAANNNFIFDTYWQVGGARIKNEVDGYLYICVFKIDPETSNPTTILPKDAMDFDISIVESSANNLLIENRFSKKVICHRGASLIEPENTVPAFEKCGKLGVWGCEMDIQYTSDGHAIIMHDKTVDRTTNGNGKIEEMTLAEIKSLNVDFGQNIESYTDLKVPTLKEAVDACRVYGTMPVFDFGILVEKEDDELLSRMLNDIAELGVLNDCLIICQTTWIASSVRAKNKNTPIVIAYSGTIGADLESKRLFRFENAYCGGWYLTSTTDEQLKDLYEIGKRDYNLQFYMLTNDKSDAKKYLELGCDFISSDDPNILEFD